MHDPASPTPNSSEPTSTVSYGVAFETVGRVIAWYSREILAERRSPAPDTARMEQLIAEHRECMQDQARLEEAGGEEMAQLNARYAARLEELGSPGA
ncbi:hypothetical protein [Streptomyces cinnamoneus]|uniref:Uncharacterized protein n=1 Tax=Streptomyces cinnamoneus TaxID=53446 RepID=A0A918TEQ9_STRCJ|nr:hypothetical protein [Streptomyces cinnamoneus]GHC44897.1 hypothetical protein GCM10010507_20010 [Streptomyces cinnamoneus]